jgi:hypothetical protein
MKTPFSRPQGRHARGNAPPPDPAPAAPAADQLAEARAARMQGVRLITDPAEIAAEIAAARQRRNGDTS